MAHCKNSCESTTLAHHTNSTKHLFTPMHHANSSHQPIQPISHTHPSPSLNQLIHHRVSSHQLLSPVHHTSSTHPAATPTHRTTSSGQLIGLYRNISDYMAPLGYICWNIALGGIACSSYALQEFIAHQGQTGPCRILMTHRSTVSSSMLKMCGRACCTGGGA